jgi:hypothetical protein
MANSWYRVIGDVYKRLLNWGDPGDPAGMPTPVVSEHVGATLVDSDGNALTMVPVSNDGTTIQVTPTITAGAYSAGDAVGELLELEEAAREAAGGGFITNITMVDKAGEEAETEFWFFSGSITDVDDNDAWEPAVADLLECVGFVSSGDGAYAAAGTPSLLSVECLLRFDLPAGTSLFLKVVTRGTPTYTSTSDLVVSVGIAQD